MHLAAAIEDRLGLVSEDGILGRVETLGELRRLVAGEVEGTWASFTRTLAPDRARLDAPPSEKTMSPTLFAKIAASGSFDFAHEDGAPGEKMADEPARVRYIYPRWPWVKPFQWMRAAFLEVVVRPLVWALANPQVVATGALWAEGPLLIIANHVTAFDVPLLQYALPGALRRRIAVAMSGEMLEGYRHFRNPKPLHPSGRFFLPGPLFYFLLTALFNVFPLPRRRDFQPSFAHAGQAMDRGFNVLVFPEGARSAEGNLAPFRPGIGLLAKQCGAMVLPVAIRGLADLKTGQRRWFRSGMIEVVVGEPVRLSPRESETAITARLHDEVERLMGERGCMDRG